MLEKERFGAEERIAETFDSVMSMRDVNLRHELAQIESGPKEVQQIFEDAKMYIALAAGVSPWGSQDIEDKDAQAIVKKYYGKERPGFMLGDKLNKRVGLFEIAYMNIKAMEARVEAKKSEESEVPAS